jgi:hypothetical protein
MGSGIGSIPIDRLVKSVEDLMQAAVPAGFAFATKAFPLSKVETVWGTAGNIPRVVFQIPQTASPAECFTMVALSFEEADQLATRRGSKSSSNRRNQVHGPAGRRNEHCKGHATQALDWDAWPTTFFVALARNQVAGEKSTISVSPL